MAHVLNIVYGSTTINLASGACSLLAYVPRAPTSLEEDATVSEPCKIEISGASVAALQTALQGIELAFRLAERYQDKRLGDRVYLEFTPDGYSTAFRAELLTGKPDFDSNTLDDRWVEKKIDVTLTWTRRVAWEGPETQIYCQDVTYLIFDQELLDPSNLIAGWEGVTGVTLDNSASGVLYVDVIDDGLGSAWAVEIYTDPMSPTTSRVGHSNYIASSGLVAITEDNASGIGGTLDLTVGTALQGMSAQWVTNTAGVPVSNHTDDDGHSNYIEMQASEVTGDLPAPVRLEIVNAYVSSNRANTIYAAQNVLSDPAGLDHILEAEDASGGTTVTGDGACSGGGRKTLSWTGTAEAELLTWTLSTSLLNACRGNYFRLLARFATTPSYTDIWAWFRIKFSLTTIWEGPPLLLSNLFSLQDLGMVQLPPYLVGAGDLYPLSLVWCVRRATSGTHNLSLDFIQLSPLDGWRRLSPRGYGLASGVRLVDDGIEEQVYTDGWSPAGKTGHYAASGQPLRVWPNARQRIYFLHDTLTGSAAIDRQLTVKVFYRPRRTTL